MGKKRRQHSAANSFKSLQIGSNNNIGTPIQNIGISVYYQQDTVRFKKLSFEIGLVGFERIFEEELENEMSITDIMVMIEHQIKYSYDDELNAITVVRYIINYNLEMVYDSLQKQNSMSFVLTHNVEQNCFDVLLTDYKGWCLLEPQLPDEFWATI